MAAEEQELDLPPPPEDPPDAFTSGHRLWIGNLDTRVTEYSLLKLLQKYGEFSKFDFLYHKTGPDQGKPRGYCFVTYSNREDAEKAKLCLNGKMALSKKLVVKDANTNTQDAVRKRVMQSAVSVDKTVGSSKSAQIRAIEAKLRVMQQSPDPGPVIGESSTRTMPSGYPNKGHGGSSRGQGHIQSQGHQLSSSRPRNSAGHQQSHSHSQRSSGPYNRRGRR